MVAPGTETWFVDALERWWRRREERPIATLFALKHPNAWGYRLILITLCVIYMTAGISKLRAS